MKHIWTILAVICALGYAVDGQKLQIGVKKRVENCTQKAKKGDLVHIHYTVISCPGYRFGAGANFRILTISLCATTTLIGFSSVSAHHIWGKCVPKMIRAR